MSWTIFYNLISKRRAMGSFWWIARVRPWRSFMVVPFNLTVITSPPPLPRGGGSKTLISPLRPLLCTVSALIRPTKQQACRHTHTHTHTHEQGERQQWQVVCVHACFSRVFCMNMCLHAETTALHRCRLFNQDTSNEPVHSLSRTTYRDFPPPGRRGHPEI